MNACLGMFGHGVDWTLKVEFVSGVSKRRFVFCLFIVGKVGVQYIDYGNREQTQTTRLAQLPALQQLSLRYNDFDAAAGAAAAWRQLPQLQELAISRIAYYPAD